MVVDTKPLIIAQISDCHLYADAQQTGYNHINPHQSLERIFQRLTLLKADCVFLTGDITNDHSEQSYRHLQQFITHYLPTTPLHVLPGNHDDMQLLQLVFDRSQLWSHGPVAYGNWHLHSLNTKTLNKSGRVSESQLANIAAHVLQFPKQNHLLAMHHHPLPCNGWMDKYPLLNAKEFWEKISALTPIKAIMHGHIHTASEKVNNGITIYSCPSSCWQWAVQADFGATDELPGCRVLHCFADGRIETEVLRVG